MLGCILSFSVTTNSVSEDTSKKWVILYWQLQCLGLQSSVTFPGRWESIFICKSDIIGHVYRDQARGRLGWNGRPGGRNFALNGTQGEVGVSLKKKKINFFFFFFRETHFHSVTTQMQAVVTLSNNLLPLHRVSPSIKWQ